MVAAASRSGSRSCALRRDLRRPLASASTTRLRLPRERGGRPRGGARVRVHRGAGRRVGTRPAHPRDRGPARRLTKPTSRSAAGPACPSPGSGCRAWRRPTPPGTCRRPSASASRHSSSVPARSASHRALHREPDLPPQVDRMTLAYSMYTLPARSWRRADSNGGRLLSGGRRLQQRREEGWNHGPSTRRPRQRQVLHPHGSKWPAVGAAALFITMLGTAAVLNGSSFATVDRLPRARGRGLHVLRLVRHVINESEGGLYNAGVDRSFAWA